MMRKLFLFLLASVFTMNAYAATEEKSENPQPQRTVDQRLEGPATNIIFGGFLHDRRTFTRMAKFCPDLEFVTSEGNDFKPDNSLRGNNFSIDKILGEDASTQVGFSGLFHRLQEDPHCLEGKNPLEHKILVFGGNTGRDSTNQNPRNNALFLIFEVLHNAGGKFGGIIGKRKFSNRFDEVVRRSVVPAMRAFPDVFSECRILGFCGSHRINVEILAQIPMPFLRSLTLPFTRQEEFDLLVQSATLANLRELNLESFDIRELGDIDTWAGPLQRLNLQNNRLSPESMRALASSKTIEKITVLDISFFNQNHEGFAEQEILKLLARAANLRAFHINEYWSLNQILRLGAMGHPSLERLSLGSSNWRLFVRAIRAQKGGKESSFPRLHLLETEPYGQKLTWEDAVKLVQEQERKEHRKIAQALKTDERLKNARQELAQATERVQELEHAFIEAQRERGEAKALHKETETTERELRRLMEEIEQAEENKIQAERAYFEAKRAARAHMAGVGLLADDEDRDDRAGEGAAGGGGAAGAVEGEEEEMDLWAVLFDFFGFS